MVRLGIIGAGQVGLKHAEALKKVTEARLVAVADIDEYRGKSLADEFGTAYYVDYHEMLNADLDAVINCLPHSLHHESALAAASQGLHILLEKPMCLTVSEADDIITACREHRVKLMMGFVHRFRDEMLEAKQLIDEGNLGRIALVADNFCMQGGKHVPRWVWDRGVAGGGVLMYGGIHSLDRLRWFVGSEVSEVYAKTRTYSQDVDVEDGLVACLEFENGVIGTLFENSPGYLIPNKWDTEVYGSGGMVRIKVGDRLEFSNDESNFVRVYRRENRFERQVKEFIAAIVEDREPWITGLDGKQSLAIALAIYQSAEQGVPVKLTDVLTASGT